MRIIHRLLRQLIWYIRFLWHRFYLRIDMDRSARIGSGVIFDRTFPQGIHIGKNTYITNNVTILTHDHVRSVWRLNTRIGKRCFIGNNAIILPGITIGDEVVVGAGSVVTRDITSNCVVAGNPAKIIRQGSRVNSDARLIEGAQNRKNV